MIHSVALSVNSWGNILITCSCGWSMEADEGITLHAIEREAHAHAFPRSAEA